MLIVNRIDRVNERGNGNLGNNLSSDTILKEIRKSFERVSRFFFQFDMFTFCKKESSSYIYLFFSEYLLFIIRTPLEIYKSI